MTKVNNFSAKYNYPVFCSKVGNICETTAYFAEELLFFDIV